MKKNLTELVFILDRSGSMYPLTEDTIGGFNSTLEEHKQGEGEVLVTTVLFNSESVILHDRKPIAEIAPITEKEYSASGCTALIDAMGSTIKHIAKIHKYAKPEDVPEHTIFVITTDGMENASCVFSAEEVRKLVEHEKQKYGWEFIFLASNIDAVQTAARYGIGESRSVNICSDGRGERIKHRLASNAIRQVRNNAASLDACSEWRTEADVDFAERGNK